MYSFRNDYNEGCHVKVLEALIESNSVQTLGYSEDEYTEAMKNLIKEKCKDDTLDIHCVIGGTQANMLVIASSLRPYQSVISAVSGHINTHETGAVEGSGHKILPIETKNGKITVKQIDEVVQSCPDEHMTQPKMVYISNPTELGTVYNVDELKEIYEYTSTHGLYLFLDGARLASVLALDIITLADLAKYTDAFYIGGTKCGAMFGEAIVLSNDALKPDFRYMIKNRGAMLAKGRLMGVQFKALLENDLYYDIGKWENKMADKLRKGFEEVGCSFDGDSPSNQLFPNINKEVLYKLEKDFDYTYMYDVDEKTCNIRLVTSYATREDMVDLFVEKLKQYYQEI